MRRSRLSETAQANANDSTDLLHRSFVSHGSEWSTKRKRKFQEYRRRLRAELNEISLKADDSFAMSQAPSIFRDTITLNTPVPVDQKLAADAVNITVKNFHKDNVSEEK